MGKNKTTGVQHISYRQMSFRKNLLKLEYVLVSLFFVFNILYLVISKVSGDNTFTGEDYILRVVVIMIIEIFCVIIYRYINLSEKAGDETKNRVCCLSMYGILAAFEVLHYGCSPLWIAPAVAMIFSTFLVDRITTILMLFGALASEALSVFMCFSDDMSLSGLRINEAIAAACFIILLFAMSMLLFKFNEIQSDDMIKYYDGEQELKEKLEKEYLTGLYSRLAIFEKLKVAMHEAYFSKSEIAVAMLDIDYFKKINDTYGHDKGDEVLRRLSSVISQYMDDDCYAGRYGGEEFLVVITNNSKRECDRILNGMLNNFRNQRYDFLPEGDIITFSVGYCMLHDYDITPERFIKCADKALYYSKEHGRNCITCFDNLK
ncbi:MAG: GGDEF domain-containing protein [Eubacteriales bacterium]|nr:GGDEF domain-containing protein [Eubacteriales bacterium]